MKKLSLLTLGLMMTIQGAFALDCKEQVANQAINKIAAEIGTIPSWLEARFITSETLNGDPLPNGLYLTQKVEVLDISYDDRNNSFDEYAGPIATYAALVNTYTKSETAEVVKCEVLSLDRQDK